MEASVPRPRRATAQWKCSATELVFGSDNAYVYLSTATRGNFTLVPHGYNDGTHAELYFGIPSGWETINGDFNGDGYADYGRIYARLGDDNAYFFYGTSNLGGFSTLAQEYQRHFGLPSSFSTVTGDFNGDGKTDYARLGGVFEHTFFRCPGGDASACSITLP